LFKKEVAVGGFVGGFVGGKFFIDIKSVQARSTVFSEVELVFLPLRSNYFKEEIIFLISS